MSGEIFTIIGVGIALGLFIWRVAARLDGRIDRLDLRIDGLQKELHDLAREFAELRGEIRGAQT
ncbi:MAG: hypothetical protein OXF11_16280 [Deltaproteobacteria bacterium]|nr:hypothetical protein [Deltaproteobacteria bacterium]